MRKVLHVGPCDTPGGMATVMRTLAEFPPEGWEAELLASHAPGGLWAKWRAYRRARRELKRRCSDPALRPDVVHVHTAADWSWRRKARLIGCLSRETGVIVHVHSGKFDTWLGTPESRQCMSFRNTVQQSKSTVVVLSEAWKETFAPLLGETLAISNPIPLHMVPSTKPRERNHLLLLGRPDPTKGHDFAIKVAQALHQERPSLRLSVTGVEHAQDEVVDALGWVSEEEKLRLLQTASLLLLPSAFEGQPMVALEASACGLPIVASEHLTSLPDSASSAGPKIEDWVSVVGKLLDNPPRPTPVDPHEHLVNVQRQWGDCYRSKLVE
ncbi:MAG: glycosyltransferase family 4 protein [Candidatus Poseidoniales archaeon]